MEKILPYIFVLAIFLSGCNSSKRQLEKGNYDAAIAKAAKQLRKDPSDTKQILILERSYKVANERDNEKIRFLKNGRTPE